MSKPKKLPSGNYRIRVYLGKDSDGKQIIKSITAPTAKECRILAAEYEAQHKRPTRTTVEQALTEFYDQRKATLAPGTKRAYRAYLRAWQKYPKLMRMSPDDVEVEDVQAVINEMVREITPKGKQIAGYTVQQRYTFFARALRKYMINLTELHLPPKRRKEIDVPDDELMKKIFKAAKGTKLEVPIMLASIGGLRRGEICALRWPEDFNGNVIHIHADIVLDVDGKWVRKEIPKTYSSNRYVEMPEQVIDLIQQQGYVCNIQPNSVTTAHEHFLKAHGFEHFRFHDYRHHMASALHAAGIPDQYIMQRMGHSSDGTLKKVYRHTLADHEQASVDAAISHFNDLLK